MMISPVLPQRTGAGLLGGFDGGKHALELARTGLHQGAHRASSGKAGREQAEQFSGSHVQDVIGAVDGDGLAHVVYSVVFIDGYPMTKIIHKNLG